jgi:protein SCO1/2
MPQLLKFELLSTFSYRRFVLIAMSALFVVNLNAEWTQIRILSSDSENLTVYFVPLADVSAEPRIATITKGDALLDYSGRDVRARVVISMNQVRLDAIWPIVGVQQKAMDGTNRRLNRTVLQMPRGQALTRGDYLPEFALFDDLGEIVYSRNLRGSPVVLTFIFSRCTVENMCPMTTGRMVELAAAIAANEIGPVQQLLVSFDPEYDTPGNLRLFSINTGADKANIRFLTGSKNVIDDITRAFGIEIVAENGTLNHTIATILTDSHGRIVLRQDGGRWSKEAILNELTRIH